MHAALLVVFALFCSGCRPRVVSEATLTIVVPKNFAGLIYIRESTGSQAVSIDSEDPEVTLTADAKGEVLVRDRQIWSWTGTGEPRSRRLIGRNDDGTALPFVNPMSKQKRAICWADSNLPEEPGEIVSILRVGPTESHFPNKLRPKPEPVVSH